MQPASWEAVQADSKIFPRWITLNKGLVGTVIIPFCLLVIEPSRSRSIWSSSAVQQATNAIIRIIRPEDMLRISFFDVT